MNQGRFLQQLEMWAKLAAFLLDTAEFKVCQLGLMSQS